MYFKYSILITCILITTTLVRSMIYPLGICTELELLLPVNVTTCI